MKISIIVPVYNVEKYIERCIKSLINQTMKEIEIIFVDDGSPDSSVEIINKYIDTNSNIRLLRKENGGLADARNYGVENAQGEYIAFVDSDDWIECKSMELLFNAAKENKADICIGNYKKIAGEFEEVIKDNGEGIRYEGTVWNKLFKRKLIIENNIKFPKGLWYEDNAFTYSALLAAKKVIYIDEVVYNYRQMREGSIMNSQMSNRIYEIYDIGNTIIDFYNKSYVYSKYKEEIEYIIIRNIFFRHVLKIIAFEKKNILKLFKKLKQHNKYINDRFPKWNNNKFLLEDRDMYFKKKIGKNYLFKLKLFRIVFR